MNSKHKESGGSSILILTWTRTVGRHLKYIMRSALLTAMLSSFPHSRLEAQPASGLIFSTANELAGISYASPYYGGSLPPQVNLSDLLPPVGDQKNQNSCVAWAVAYALKTYHEQIEDGIAVIESTGQATPSRTFSPAFIYNQINNRMDSGARYMDALNLVHRIGAATLATMPYNPLDYRTRPSSRAYFEANNYRIDYWNRVDQNDVIAIKELLYAGYPILFGANVDEGFRQGPPNSLWNGASGPVLGGHAMIVVGYDDQKRAFRFMNSWGKDWADGGYAWIDYAYFSSIVKEAFVVRDAVNGTVFDGATDYFSQMMLDAHGDTVRSAITGGGAGGGGGGGGRGGGAGAGRGGFSSSVTVAATTVVSPSRAAQVTVLRTDSLPGAAQRDGVVRFSGLITVPEYSGKSYQLGVAIFRDGENGRKAGPLRGVVAGFTSPHGNVVSATPSRPIAKGGSRGDWSLSIPVEAMRDPNGLTTGDVKLLAEITLFLDGFGVKKLPLIPLTVRF